MITAFPPAELQTNEICLRDTISEARLATSAASRLKSCNSLRDLRVTTRSKGDPVFVWFFVQKPMELDRLSQTMNLDSSPPVRIYRWIGILICEANVFFDLSIDFRG